MEIKRFENDIISITPIKKTTSAVSIKPITQQNKELKAVQDEIKVFTEDDHLNKSTEEIKEEIKEEVAEAIEEVQENIASLDSMTVAELKELAKSRGLSGYSRISLLNP